ncbi:MAG: trypsin-like peptidase domain-containing protein [Spirochaetota bacterium]
MTQKNFLLFPLFLFFLLFSPIFSGETQDFETIRKGVVQIKVFSQGIDPYSPWLPSRLRASSGTGFIIEGNKILTNAHVVSNAKYVQVQRHNQTEWYDVKILHIAHDCDLALLEAIDKTFYKDSHVFSLGNIPELNSPVTVVGFPIGGSKISVSRGIVSRKEQSTYAHSQIDNHLVIQVDAAINPGNSGGPAIQEGKVVGVAFQVSTRGENIGYLIPTTVIQYFLKDIEDGSYEGYVELGVQTMNSFNQGLRKLKQIPEKYDGVFVTKVLKGGSAEGYLQNWDLILSIDDLPVGKNGTIVLDKDTRIDFVEVVDNKHAGEQIKLQVFRAGKVLQLQFPAKKMRQFEYMRNTYEKGFNYFILGGLVFQEHSRSLLHAWSQMRETQGGSQFLYRFFYFIKDQLNKEIESDVIFYRRLAHPINSSSGYFLNLILESVNGIKIRNLKHLKTVCKNLKDEYFILKFRDVKTSLILKRQDVEKATPNIRKIYNLDNSL